MKLNGILTNYNEILQIEAFTADLMCLTLGNNLCLSVSNFKYQMSGINGNDTDKKIANRRKGLILCE